VDKIHNKSRLDRSHFPKQDELLNDNDIDEIENPKKQTIISI
jgi:hypothetical protein